MRVLLIGAGTVGEAIARLSAEREWCEAMIVADSSLDRAQAVEAKIGQAGRFRAERVDGRDQASVAELARSNGVDLVMNAVDPRFLIPIFDAALDAGANYMDMATSLSRPHPTQPYRLTGVKLADEQFDRATQWQAAGRLALVGMGMDPGLSDVFARHAASHLFDEVDEVHVRDGGDLRIPGFAFAPVFSIWTTIENASTRRSCGSGRTDRTARG